MRHLLSVVLSIILAPVIYVAAGLAALKLDAARLNSTSIHWTDAEIGLAAAVVAGALYAFLVMSGISPLGPAIAGLAYLGMTLWAFLQPTSFHDRFDFDIAGQHGVLLQPAGAGLLLLAIPLLATVFSSRRWSPGPPVGLPYDAAPIYPAAPDSAAPVYGDPPTLTLPHYPTMGSYGDEPTPPANPLYTPSSSATTPYSYAPGETSIDPYHPDQEH
jgi:hypothetical protein